MIVIGIHLEVYGNNIEINHLCIILALFFLFFDNSTGVLYEFKQQTIDWTSDDVTKIIEIKVPLKFLSNFWRTLEIPLIYCEINLILTWSSNCVISLASAEN